jgi:capsid protein
MKESDEVRSLDLDTETDQSIRPDDGTPHLEEVGLTAGSVARIGKDESVEVVESKRPGPLIEPFVRFLSNRVAMSSNLSWHRFTGDPTGASFATLRAMINDDRAMALPITYAFGRKIAVQPRKQHDRICAGMGLFASTTAQDYLRDEWIYQEFDVLGPPLRNLNPVEDAESAKSRISAGLSTLRIECALLGLSYRRVMRQLAVERDLAAALRLALDFSRGGGQASNRTTTDATEVPA